jgi:hypothetical protein
MSGKFTAQASWRDVVVFSQPLTGDSGDGGSDEGAAGETFTYRVGGLLPVIVWIPELQQRRTNMRWAIPDRNGAPKHIHARAETVDRLPTFRESSLKGRRGIADRPDGRPATRLLLHYTQAGVPNSPEPIWVCVMVTVTANELIRRMIKEGEDDPRMPAIMADEYDAGRLVWARMATIRPRQRRFSRPSRA